MRITVNIRKEKKAFLWGHVCFMDQVLVENGRSVEELQGKLRAALEQYYELEMESCQFVIVTAHTLKAQQMVARLKNKPQYPPMEIHFNSAYFTV